MSRRLAILLVSVAALAACGEGVTPVAAPDTAPYGTTAPARRGR